MIINDASCASQQSASEISNGASSGGDYKNLKLHGETVANNIAMKMLKSNDKVDQRMLKLH